MDISIAIGIVFAGMVVTVLVYMDLKKEIISDRMTLLKELQFYLDDYKKNLNPEVIAENQKLDNIITCLDIIEKWENITEEDDIEVTSEMMGKVVDVIKNSNKELLSNIKLDLLKELKNWTGK